jgi:hypothetical protein
VFIAAQPSRIELIAGRNDGLIGVSLHVDEHHWRGAGRHVDGNFLAVSSPTGSSRRVLGIFIAGATRASGSMASAG